MRPLGHRVVGGLHARSQGAHTAACEGVQRLPATQGIKRQQLQAGPAWGLQVAAGGPKHSALHTAVAHAGLVQAHQGNGWEPLGIKGMQGCVCV